METINQNQKSLRNLFVIFAIGSSAFDISQFLHPTGNTDIFQVCQLTLKDLMYIGLSGLVFIKTSYEELSLKSLAFMFIIWRTGVLLFNLSNLYYPSIIVIMYAIYIFWLCRILTLKEIQLPYRGKAPSIRTYTYNIFIPVHSFRGLLKSLIPTFSDPRYETTIFICGNTMHYVKNKRFHEEVKDEKIIQALINKTNAKVTLGNATPRQIKAIKRLSTKTAITGLRDCGKLRI